MNGRCGLMAGLAARRGQGGEAGEQRGAGFGNRPPKGVNRIPAGAIDEVIVQAVGRCAIPHERAEQEVVPGHPAGVFIS
jgi:hypothetical protein